MCSWATYPRTWTVESIEACRLRDDSPIFEERWPLWGRTAVVSPVHLGCYGYRRVMVRAALRCSAESVQSEENRSICFVVKQASPINVTLMGGPARPARSEVARGGGTFVPRGEARAGV